MSKEIITFGNFEFEKQISPKKTVWKYDVDINKYSKIVV